MAAKWFHTYEQAEGLGRLILWEEASGGPVRAMFFGKKKIASGLTHELFHELEMRTHLQEFFLERPASPGIARLLEDMAFP